MREGDIYRWRYTEEYEDTRGLSYHCRSRIAVYENGRLYDTFWGSSPTDTSWLNPDKVHLTLLGNRNDLEELSDNEEYYNPEDLVVMRHSNNSRAKTLVKPEATRDPEVMRKLALEKRGKAERDLQSAARDIARAEVALDAINRGDIDKLYF